MRIITFFAIILINGFLFSQDTLRVMHYNLLYYGENSGFCNWTNNNPDQKDAFLRTIISYARPDIFTVNEISYQSTYQQRILSEVMNQTGYALFKMAGSPNMAESNIVNQLYYNSEKLALHSQEVAQSEVRDIDIYRLYYLNDGLLDGDTIFIHCMVAHLKAGTSSSDEDKRELMTANALNYLDEHGRPGNYLFMGDFNVYEAAEPAFQLMINHSNPEFRFYDPVDEIGDWHTSPAYRHVHTQSTHAYSNCFAGGGMDDRFDFVLMNSVIKDADDKVQYVEGSYQALGQDGIRLDESLIDPPNNSLPAYVIDALYGMSDHLPVVMDLVVDEELWIPVTGHRSPDIHYANPVKDKLRIYFSQTYSRPVIISLVSTTGAVQYQRQHKFSDGTITIPTSHLPTGMYFLRMYSEKEVFTGKVIVVN